jgi:hypothetical protein
MLSTLNHHLSTLLWPVTANITTIADIKKRTGISFLPGVSASKRAEMENFKAPALGAKE